MVSQDSVLVTLVKLVDRLPMPAPPVKRGRGQPKVYSDRLFLKALVIMIVRHLHQVNELLSVLAQPTAEMTTLRALLQEQGNFPTRRTWERRLKAIPQCLPAQIGCLGRQLVALIHPWANAGRAVAIDSTILQPGEGSGIKSIESRENFPTARLIPKLIGPNRAGTAGCMAGNSTWFRLWLASGFLLLLC